MLWPIGDYRKSTSLVVTVTLLSLLLGGTLACGQNVKAIEAQGKEQGTTGKFDQAIDTFDHGLKPMPNDSALSYLRGKA